MWECNDKLEQAFANAHRGTEETVEFFRLLRECNLTFTAPYHPEIEGENKIGSDGKMVITVWTVNGEQVIPIFTTPERLDEAMLQMGKPGEKYAAGQMAGRELFRAFCPPHNKLRVAINPGCSCGTHFLKPEQVQGILDGSALEIPTAGEMAMGGLVISLPDRQPAKLREPLTKFLAGIPEVKAAWLFYEEEPKSPSEQVYVLGLAIVGGEATEICREAALAIASVCPPEWGSRAIIMDPQDPGFSDIMRCQSFYRTADYVPPPKSPEPKK
jgi:hypothetical protein